MHLVFKVLLYIRAASNMQRKTSYVILSKDSVIDLVLKCNVYLGMSLWCTHCNIEANWEMHPVTNVWHSLLWYYRCMLPWPDISHCVVILFCWQNQCESEIITVCCYYSSFWCFFFIVMPHKVLSCSHNSGYFVDFIYPPEPK